MRRLSLIELVTFLAMFLYFYKTSGKFRKSIIYALVIPFIFSFGPLESEAKGTEAFTPQQQIQTSRVEKNKGLFNRGARKPNPNGNGSGKPGGGDGSDGDDNDIVPQYPKRESVQETEKRIDNIYEFMNRMIMDESSDSDEEQSLSGSWNYHNVRKELAKQSGKKKIQIQVGDQIYMFKNPNREHADDLESILDEKMYNSIRECDTDICTIAENLGFKADNIKNVKDQVFYNQHKLDRYPDKIEHKRFDASLEQALAWKRLETGTHTQDDVTWIKHECSERHHELKYNSGYNEAHERAQSRYDGYPWKNKF